VFDNHEWRHLSGINADLLRQFPRQGDGLGFSGLALSARIFPESTLVLVCASLGQQHVCPGFVEHHTRNHVHPFHV